MARKKPPQSARQRHGRGERVHYILGESLECFAREGFERVTYDDLIERSKVSRGSFYWYFPSKEALYDAVLDFCVNGYAARLEAAFEKTSPRDHIIKRLLDTVLADFAQHRSQYRLLMRPPPSSGAMEKLIRWNDDTYTFLRGKLAPLVAQGRLDSMTAGLLPDVLSAFLDGICVRSMLDVKDAVPRLSRNVEAFLCRVVNDKS